MVSQKLIHGCYSSHHQRGTHVHISETDDHASCDVESRNCNSEMLSPENILCHLLQSSRKKTLAAQDCAYRPWVILLRLVLLLLLLIAIPLILVLLLQSLVKIASGEGVLDSEGLVLVYEGLQAWNTRSEACGW